MTNLALAVLVLQIALAAALGPCNQYRCGGRRQVFRVLAHEIRTKSRRDVMAEIIYASAIIALPVITPNKAAASTKTLQFETVREIARYIKLNCNQQYLESVRSSDYNFLYRGEDIKLSSQGDKLSVFVINDPPDLLDQNTYQSTEAAEYFQGLEDILSASGSNVKPSNGHLATTCPVEAAKWGTSVSVWPLGKSGVEFAWLKDGGIFWPPPNDNLERKVVVGGAGLDVALQGDAWEIMFRADNGMLAIPAELDDDLKHLLAN